MGDEQRFDAVYRDHAAAVVRYLRRRVEPAVVEDLAADVFVVAWEKLDRVSPGEELPWLYRIAANHVANHRRKRRDHLYGAFPGDQGGPAPVWEDVLHTGMSHNGPEITVPETIDLRSAFSELSADDRTVLMLAAWEQLSGDEIAAVLGCSPAAARQRLLRARTRFVDLLG